MGKVIDLNEYAKWTGKRRDYNPFDFAIDEDINTAKELNTNESNTIELQQLNWNDIAEQNRCNQERLRKERYKNNENTKNSYRIYPKKTR